MEKKYEHFVSNMDFKPGKNLVWDFVNCKECHKNSLHVGSLMKTPDKNDPKFVLCNRCAQEIESLKKAG